MPFSAISCHFMSHHPSSTDSSHKLKYFYIILFLFILIPNLCYSNDDIRHIRCGVETVGKLMSAGWKFEKREIIKEIVDNIFILFDGTKYKGDLTAGIFAYDEAIILSKFVKGKKTSGTIYNLCAGGFDSWVIPLPST